MIRFFVAIVLSSFLSSCEPRSINAKSNDWTIKIDTVAKSETQLNRNTGIVFYQSKPFTGTTVTYYENGNFAEAVDFVDGRKSGWFKKWFSDGLLSFQSPYKEGKQHGATKSWWSNGNLRSESLHENGVLNGIQKQWYNTGEKFKETSVKDGVVEGIQKAWRKNGKLYANFEVKNGRTFGLQRANLCYQLKDEKIQIKE